MPIGDAPDCPLGAQTAGRAEPVPDGEDATASAFDATGMTTLPSAPEPLAGHVLGLDAPAEIPSPGDTPDDVAANVTFDNAAAAATVDGGFTWGGGGVTTDDET